MVKIPLVRKTLKFRAVDRYPGIPDDFTLTPTLDKPYAEVVNTIQTDCAILKDLYVH